MEALNMKRKVLTALACSALLMGMAACSSNDKIANQSKAKQEEKVQTIQKQPKDSYVVSADDLSKAAKINWRNPQRTNYK